MFAYLLCNPSLRSVIYRKSHQVSHQVGCSGFVITRQSSHRLQCHSSSCSSQWGYADQESMKKPILLTRIMSRCRLKALTEQASTVSCVRLFQRFNTRCEKKCSLMSVRQWALTSLRDLVPLRSSRNLLFKFWTLCFEPFFFGEGAWG